MQQIQFGREKSNASKTPALPQGKLVINGIIDLEQVKKRKDNINPFYSGAPVTQTNLDVLPGEPVFYYGPNSKTVDDLRCAMSSLNGLGKDTNEFVDIMANIHVLGIAGANGERKDSSNPEFPIVFRGVATRMNDSDKSIKCGDQLMWTLPPMDQLARKGSKGSKLTLLVEPYNPDVVKGFPDLMAEIVRKRSNGEIIGRSIVEDSLTTLEEASKIIALNLVNTLLSTGIITINPEIFKRENENLREDNIKKNKKHANHVINQIATHLGVHSQTPPKYIKTDKGIPLNVNFTNSLLGRSEDYLLIKETSSLSAEEKELNKKNRTSLEKLYYSVNQAISWYKSRGIGWAITSATPGQPYDYMLGVGVSS